MGRPFALVNSALALALLIATQGPLHAQQSSPEAAPADGTKWTSEFGLKLEQIYKEEPALLDLSMITEGMDKATAQALWAERFQQIRAKIPGMADTEDNKNCMVMAVSLLTLPQSEKDRWVKENADLKQSLLDSEAIFEKELQKAAEEKKKKEIQEYLAFKKKQTQDLLDAQDAAHEQKIAAERKVLIEATEKWEQMQNKFVAQEKADEPAADSINMGPAQATALEIQSKQLAGAVLLMPGVKNVTRFIHQKFSGGL